MMIRREVFERIGLLGEQFFIYYEELDFAERAKRAGFAIQYVPDALVLHKESITVGKANPFKIYHMTRNRLLYLRRNVQGLALLSAVLFFAFFSLPIGLLRHALQRRFDLAWAMLRGVSWHLQPRTVHSNPPLHTTFQPLSRHDFVPASAL